MVNRLGAERGQEDENYADYMQEGKTVENADPVKAVDGKGYDKNEVVEDAGLEPAASTMPLWRSPS